MPTLSGMLGKEIEERIKEDSEIGIQQESQTGVKIV